MTASILDTWSIAMHGAQTIALRCWLMVPQQGRTTAWQQREASAMVIEKLAALQQAQLAATLGMWRMAMMPWGGHGPQALMSAVLAPYVSRTRSNSRRLARRANVHLRRI